MKNKTKEAVVGFVSILAISVLIISIIYGKNISLSTEKKEITVLFESVNGLEIGSKVFAKGVPCGTVISVDLADDIVVVKADIDTKINIYSDAVATVENKEIMGGKMLVLFPGISNILLNGNVIKGKVVGSINQSINEVSEIAAYAKVLIARTDTLIGKLNTVIPKKDIDARLDEISKETITTLRSIKTTMNSINKKFDTTLIKTGVLIDSIQSSVDGTKSKIYKTLPEIDKLVSSTEKLIESLNERAETLSDTTGTIGKLINSDDFYFKLERAVTDIDSLVKKIDREGLKTNIDLW